MLILLHPHHTRKAGDQDDRNQDDDDRDRDKQRDPPLRKGLLLLLLLFLLDLFLVGDFLGFGDRHLDALALEMLFPVDVLIGNLDTAVGFTVFLRAGQRGDKYGHCLVRAFLRGKVA